MITMNATQTGRKLTVGAIVPANVRRACSARQLVVRTRARRTGPDMHLCYAGRFLPDTANGVVHA